LAAGVEVAHVDVDVCRVHAAVFNVSITNDVCRMRAAFQPTMRPENASMTNAMYTIPDHAEQYVKSATILVRAGRGEVTAG
jgi:hypothetical protein